MFLSGGVDSSLVAYLMQKNSEKKLGLSQLVLTKYDESSYAKQISDSIGSNHHQIMVSSMDMLDNLESIVNIFDEPFSDSSFIPTFLISKLPLMLRWFSQEMVEMRFFLGYNRYIFANKILKIKKYFPNFLERLFQCV